jgi:hypothetical protein
VGKGVEPLAKGLERVSLPPILRNPEANGAN